MPRVREQPALTGLVGNGPMGGHSAKAGWLPWRRLSSAPQGPGRLITLNWASPLRRLWRHRRRLVRVASTAQPLKAGNAGNGYSALHPRVFGFPEQSEMWSARRKPHAWEQRGLRVLVDNWSVAETSEIHPRQVAGAHSCVLGGLASRLAEPLPRRRSANKTCE